jgi:hypothetical protein
MSGIQLKSVKREYSEGHKFERLMTNFFQNKKLLKPTHVLKENLSVDNAAILL